MPPPRHKGGVSKNWVNSDTVSVCFGLGEGAGGGRLRDWTDWIATASDSGLGRPSKRPIPSRADANFRQPMNNGITVQLQGRNVIVTGGGAGIGRAVAERFVVEGASVMIAELDESDQAEGRQRHSLED